jgi:peptide/nickel transport system substrate-binding protein
MAAAGPDNYRNNPQGSGAFKYVSQQARTSLTMEPYENYYKDKARLDRVIILPMSEATTRLAALRTNAADWVEVPPPDALPGLESDGFQIYMTQTSHNWPHQINLSQQPFDNKLVRQAMNFAIDRVALCRDLLNNTCEPATSFANQATPWVGESESFYSYDPDRARALLAEAGVQLPLTYTVLVSASGSGQMLPVPMNEFVQRNLAAVGINMEMQVIEWNTYIQQLRNGFVDGNAELDGANISWLSVDPANFIRQFYSGSVPPNGWNIPGYSNPDVDELLEQARATSDLELRDQYLTQANQIITEDAPWLFIAHDRNPRVLSPRVKNYIQEKHTYTSIVNVWVE